MILTPPRSKRTNTPFTYTTFVRLKAGLAPHDAGSDGCILRERHTDLLRLVLRMAVRVRLDRGLAHGAGGTDHPTFRAGEEARAGGRPHLLWCRVWNRDRKSTRLNSSH